MAKHEKIRIRLKAFEHELLDQSAEKNQITTGKWIARDSTTLDWIQNCLLQI